MSAQARVRRDLSTWLLVGGATARHVAGDVTAQTRRLHEERARVPLRLSRPSAPWWSLEGTTADEVMVLSEAGGLRAIPVHRR